MSDTDAVEPADRAFWEPRAGGLPGRRHVEAPQPLGGDAPALAARAVARQPSPVTRFL